MKTILDSLTSEEIEKELSVVASIYSNENVLKAILEELKPRTPSTANYSDTFEEQRI